MKIKIFILTSLIFISCSNDDELNNTVSTIDVYATGSINGNASYWKNSEQITLDNDGYSDTYASEIIVTESNTYILGGANINQDINPDENMPNLFWENGVVTNLNSDFSEPDFEVFRIQDFYVYNGDVYILGVLKNITNRSQFNLVYWKNGTKTVLLNNIEAFCTSYLRVLNDDVYIYYTDNTLFGVQGIIANTNFDLIDSNYATVKMEANESEVYIYGQFPYSTDGFYYNYNTDIETITPYAINELDLDQNDVFALASYNEDSFLGEIFNNTLYYQSNLDRIDSFEMYNDKLYVIERNTNGQQILFADNIPLITLENAEGFFDNIIRL